MRPELTVEGVPERLWTLVSVATHRLLMLDYDGTLAPFNVARDEARPLPRSLALLSRLCETDHTSVAIVSGRPLSEVERLVGSLRAVLVGEHGWEYRNPDGQVVQRPLGDTLEATLDQAQGIARSLGWESLIERKRSAVVLHTRALAPEQAAALEDRAVAAWRTYSATGVVSLDRIDGGVELRAYRRHKGTVVSSLLSRAPTGTLGVFVGDDVTDEDAFEVVRDRGFGVRVGAGDRPTLAMGRLPSCEDVPAFLERWLAVTEARVG